MSMEVKEGAQVGRYSLLTRIARGGMADVWLARATGAEGFQKTVVIKTLLPHLATEPEFVRMFIDEALFAANLSHPNIVHIFDLGEVQNAYFIAMEYISGRTLRHIQRELKRTRRVPPPWLVLQVACMVCEALQYAHGKLDADGKPLKLVHRDISPENVMVSFDGETKVLDFGIAKATTAVSKTRVGVLKGKYAYMAPEQIENAMEGVAADHRVDIYALGVVMYEMVTGRRPFRAQNDLALLRKILDTQPEPPCAVCNWISEPLSALILKAMARNPDDRFESAAALRAAIEAHFDSVGSTPSRRHVADYVRSLFGDTAADIVPPGPSSEDPITGRSEPPDDPWALESIVTAGDEDSSVTIDLSMVLAAEDDGSDHDMAGTPGGLLDGPPSSRLPSLAETARFAQAAGSSARTPVPPPIDLDAVDQLWPDIASGLHRPLTAPPPETAPPAEVPRPPEIPAAKASEPPQAVRGHSWDLVTRRAREQRASVAAPAHPPATPPAASHPETDHHDGGEPKKDRHDWDAVVQRMRRTDSPGRAASREREEETQSPEARALALFEEGLEKMRARDAQGAHACWSKAVELDPGNRVYQSNLRVLKRQLAERDR